MIEAGQEFQVAAKLLDLLHKLLNGHLIGFVDLHFSTYIRVGTLRARY